MTKMQKTPNRRQVVVYFSRVDSVPLNNILNHHRDAVAELGQSYKVHGVDSWQDKDEEYNCTDGVTRYTTTLSSRLPQTSRGFFHTALRTGAVINPRRASPASQGRVIFDYSKKRDSDVRTVESLLRELGYYTETLIEARLQVPKKAHGICVVSPHLAKKSDPSNSEQSSSLENLRYRENSFLYD